jgi:hypothetical protein
VTTGTHLRRNKATFRVLFRLPNQPVKRSKSPPTKKERVAVTEPHPAIQYEQYEATRDALVQKLMNTAQWDDKAPLRVRMLIASAATEFIVLALASLPEPGRIIAVEAIVKGLSKRVEAMVTTLAEDR